MKVLTKKAKKVMEIMSWTHLSDDEKQKKIESVLSEVYDLGLADGYANGYAHGFEEGW